jgi:hypothetical protein
VGSWGAVTLTKENLLREAIAREKALLADLTRRQIETKARLAMLQEELVAAESRPWVASTPALPSLIEIPTTAQDKISLFRQLFPGRDDVFAKLWESTKTGRKGYAPACGNEWVSGVCEKPRVKCGDCPNEAFLPRCSRTLVS